MTTEDIIIHIFCKVDDRMPNVKKHPQAKLYPSELVTIGLLFALKGGYFRAFSARHPPPKSEIAKKTQSVWVARFSSLDTLNHIGYAFAGS